MLGESAARRRLPTAVSGVFDLDGPPTCLQTRFLADGSIFRNIIRINVSAFRTAPGPKKRVCKSGPTSHSPLRLSRVVPELTDGTAGAGAGFEDLRGGGRHRHPIHGSDEGKESNMSSRTTKTTLRALARTEFVVMSIRTQKTTVGAELGRVFGGSLPTDGSLPMPDWESLQEAHALRLEDSAEQVHLTDRHHRQNRAQISGLRKQRRQMVRDLQRQYRDLRVSVTDTYDEAGLIVLGLEDLPARRFVGVRKQIPEIIERLRDPELPVQLPEPRPGHQALDFEHYAGVLDAEVQALEESSESIRRMRKHLDESVVAKGEALKENRRIYLQLARVQEGYYRLAGLDELADRIRTEVFKLGKARRKELDPETPESPPKSGDSSADPASPPPGAPPPNPA